MEQYKNIDGTYTSPKNSKTYKSLKAFTAHWYYAGSTEKTAISSRVILVKCKFCNKSVTSGNLIKHENSCYVNPINKKILYGMRKSYKKL